MDRGEANTGGLPHVDGALLCQVHVVEVNELKLGLLFWPEGNKSKQKVKQLIESADKMLVLQIILYT